MNSISDKLKTYLYLQPNQPNLIRSMSFDSIRTMRRYKSIWQEFELSPLEDLNNLISTREFWQE
jgi:hypothetical protein